MKFIETIRMVNGQIQLLPLHLARMARSLNHRAPDLGVCLRMGRDLYPEGVVKCRIEYDSSGILQSSFIRYVPRSIKTLCIAHLPEGFDYSLKYADRSKFEELISREPRADELLLVRDGLITDTTYTNVVLSRQDCYYTPSKPLLAGVMRSSLLSHGKLVLMDISQADLHLFERIYLINAMLPLGSIVLPVSSVLYR